MSIDIRIDPHPDRDAFAALWEAGWGTPFAGPLPRWDLSLLHLGAYDGDRLVGYLNVATDGGVHAFLLDPIVHPAVRRRGLGTRLVRRATDVARERGARWLHVDYAPQLAAFYAGCGFRPTQAGLIQLAAG